MSSRFDKWLRPILDEAMQEMFPTPPTIQGPRPPVPEPERQPPPEPVVPEPAYPPAEREAARPRIERVDIRDADAILERDIRRPRTEDIAPRTKRPARPPAAARVTARPPRPQLRDLLGSQASLRQAILIQEILGPPKSLRRE